MHNEEFRNLYTSIRVTKLRGMRSVRDVEHGV